jgi:predicted nucleic acid-binding protein
MTHYLLDTNILIRSRDIASSDYNLVDRTIRYLISNNHQCLITSQVLIEFWVVATRPVTVNGLGCVNENRHDYQNYIRHWEARYASDPFPI